MSKAYYNEFDRYAAQWLRNLIKAGLIAPGDVDERSIEDVKPTDLVGYTQCHFFAGIGVWSAALRGAGWPDDRPVWTGSCPCQPFSTAGKGEGFADERHLWPAWLHLIKHGKSPEVPVFGEQVASDDGLTWLDIVRTDLEGEGFEVRPVDLCAAGVGAPHIRQRLFFVAERADGVTLGDTIGSRLERLRWHEQDGCEPGRNGTGTTGPVTEASKSGSMADTRRFDSAGRGDVGDVGEAPTGNEGTGEERERLRDAADHGGTDDGMANAGHDERGGRDAVRAADGEHGGAEGAGEGAGAEWIGPEHDASVRGAGCGVADADGVNEHAQRESKDGASDIRPESGRLQLGVTGHSPALRTGPTNGFWRDADWLFCKDGKWRPVEPGTQPLADGTAQVVGRMRPRLEAMGIDPADIGRILGQRNSALAIAGRNRTGRLHGYGNAINKEVTEAFIKAVMTCNYR